MCNSQVHFAKQKKPDSKGHLYDILEKNKVTGLENRSLDAEGWGQGTAEWGRVVLEHFWGR